MTKYVALLVAALTFTLAAIAVAEEIPKNPFLDPDRFNRDYSRSHLVNIYDGKFDDITHPEDGNREKQLSGLVFDYFEGLHRAMYLDGCYPTGITTYPWVQIFETKDMYGNVRDSRETKMNEYMPPEVRPLYEKYDKYLNNRGSSAFWGAREFVNTLKCSSPEYQHMFQQMLRMSDGILNGFEADQTVDELAITRDQRIKFVRNCLYGEVELTARGYQQCVCLSRVSQKYYEKADLYISSAYSYGDGILSEADMKIFSKDFQKECFGRVGTHRPEISELIEDLAPDIK